MTLPRLCLLAIVGLPAFAIAAQDPETVAAEFVRQAVELEQQRNLVEACRAFEKASDLGNLVARQRLARCYRTGDGGERNVALADELMRGVIEADLPQARAGEAKVQIHLYLAYRQPGASEDPGQAAMWLIRAAESGDPKAQYALGQQYSVGTLAPAIEQDPVKAREWLEKSALQGNKYARQQLARKSGYNLDEVLYWCLDLAKEGDEACLEVVNVTIGRTLPLKKYQQQALAAVQTLAESGIGESQLALGQIYEQGLVVSKDPTLAGVWYSRGLRTTLAEAASGDAEAQFAAGVLYSRGIGTDVDVDQARLWLQRAADQGFSKADAFLARLKATAE